MKHMKHVYEGMRIGLEGCYRHGIGIYGLAFGR